MTELDELLAGNAAKPAREQLTLWPAAGSADTELGVLMEPEVGHGAAELRSAHDRGTCTNRFRIRRDILEASVLSGLKTHIMHPALVREFTSEYRRELSRLSSIADQGRNLTKHTLIQTEREIRAIIDAIKGGWHTSSLRDELIELEERKSQLTRELREMQPILVQLNPNLAELYQHNVSRLHEKLNCDAVRDEAAQILRDLIREVRLIPQGDGLEIELVGDLAALLAFGSESPRHDGITGARITLVAGEGVEPPTLGL